MAIRAIPLSCTAVLLVALAHPTAAPATVWNVGGQVEFVARYDRRVVRGTRTFSVRTTVDDVTGVYALTASNALCGYPDGPAVVTTGRWQGSERGLFAHVLRATFRETVRICTGTTAAFRSLTTRVRIDGDGTLDGRFRARAAIRVPLGDDVDVYRTTLRGRVQGVRSETD